MLLEGIRVVDLTTVVMGPLATRMLADMGADVIWVESPQGDVLREYEPMRSPKMGAFSMSVSRNKRSVVLDLKSDPGKAAMHDLIASADVFVTNLRRKAIDRREGSSPQTLTPMGVRILQNGVDYFRG